MVKRFPLACVSAVILAAMACSSGGNPETVGRFDSNIFPVAADRFIIKYHGDPGMTSRVIREQLLYRAAETTLQRGFGYFTLKDSSALASDLAQPSLYGSAGDALGPSASHLSPADRLDPCGPEMERGGGLTTLYSSTAVVWMLKEPGAQPRVYDARRLVNEIQARWRDLQGVEP